MRDKIPMIEIAPRVTYRAKDNTEKIPEILKKLRINDEKIAIQVTEELKCNKNCNEIINILEYLTEKLGCKRTHENLFELYRINRDLLWLGSPIWSEPRDFIDDLYKFPYKEQKLDLNDIVQEYLDGEYMKGREYDRRALHPNKKNIEWVLRSLMHDCRIYSFALEDIYEDILKKDEEADDWLEPSHEIKVIKIL